jgi:RNA polymerase sigma-70 factor (ECF subfamily)
MSGPAAGAERGGAGLRQAVAEAFLELRDPVYRYLLGMLEPGEAEDTAQEAFLRLFSELRSGRPVGNVRAWLFQTAHNLAIDRTRRSAREEHWDEQAWRGISERLLEPGPDAQRLYLDKERADGLRAALAGLTAQERRCMELRAEGLRYREIAEVLGVKISSVQNYLARAIGKVMRRGDA